jgi:general secretion pathway protein K
VKRQPTARCARLASRGAALLVALLTLSLIAIWTALSVSRVGRLLDQDIAQQQQTQGEWVHASVRDWARVNLQMSIMQDGIDHYGKPWATRLQRQSLSSFLVKQSDVVLEDGAEYVSAQVFDEQAKFNLTNLLNGSELNIGALDSLTQLFNAAGLNGLDAEPLARQWLAVHRPVHADSGSIPLVPQHLDQLQWLGLRAADIDKLRPYVTILPRRTAVNINTASREVLAATMPALESEEVEALIRERVRPMKSLSEAAEKVPSIQGLLQFGEHGVNSQFFELHSTVSLGAYQNDQNSLLQREGQSVRVIWSHSPRRASRLAAAVSTAASNAVSASSR